MAQIILPYKLLNNTAADANQVMANFNSIVDVVNGRLGSDNLGSISGGSVQVTGLNGVTESINSFTKRFQAGVERFENLQPGETVYRDISFPVSFPDPPIVFVSPRHGGPGLLAASYANVTTTDFRMFVTNHYDIVYDNDVAWLAIYLG